MFSRQREELRNADVCYMDGAQVTFNRDDDNFTVRFGEWEQDYDV